MHTCRQRHPLLCIVPPHLLVHLARQRDARLRRLADQALRTLLASEQIRGNRRAIGGIAPLAATPAGAKRRTIFDAEHGSTLPGRLVRSESDPASTDVSVNEAYDGLGATWDFYFGAYQRNSIDGRGLRLDASVHYRQQFDNAFWDGQQMVFGDGDSVIFERFTKCIDVIGHELTHGVTQYEANLAYEGQPGALNESVSDVFGSLVKQYALQQTADKADWLIGAGLFTPDVKGMALRSMKDPGTAYDDPRLGKDPQPAHMRDYVDTPDDNGGVHINSGIPNRAFCLAALGFGGRAWLKAGRVWYLALTDALKERSDFRAAAAATITVAGHEYGKDAADIVRQAWRTVGVTLTAPRSQPKKVSRANSRGAKRRVRRPASRTRRRD
jgi:Zn-dependent metalloprotease